MGLFPRRLMSLLDFSGDFHRDALDLMNAISPGTLFKWGLRDREPLRQYAGGALPCSVMPRIR